MALWRETLDHLRHLSDDVWMGFKTFLVFNGFILISMALLISSSRRDRSATIFIGLLSIAGILLTFAARYILKRNRIYYLQMLAKKSLLEEDLGFYRTTFDSSPIDFAFPWRLAPEVVAEVRKDCDAWVQKSIRASGTIARFQFLIYEVLVGLYVLGLLAVILTMFR